jgi:SAM-dependent methyltransferase
MEPTRLGSLPIPPADLMLRVVGSFGPDDIESAQRGFDLGGRNNLAMFERALAAVPKFRFGGDVWLDQDRAGVARSFSDFERLLDFGCGCGRLLRHLGDVADGVQIHGTDIDAEMVEWLQRNMPFGQYAVASREPPLPYPDEHFDLVISHSVFTHLDERHQDLWLRELRRITRQDALLLVSVQGEATWTRTCADAQAAGYDTTAWRTELAQRGVLFISNDAFVGSTHPDFYHSTLHTPWYVFDHWSEHFEVAAYIVDGAWAQDLVVLRRSGEQRSSRPAPPSARSGPSSVGSVGSRRPPPRLAAAAGRIPKAAIARLLRGALSSVGQEPYPAGQGSVELGELARQVEMLRAGVYEQGQRISVLAAQLRNEIRDLRD